MMRAALLGLMLTIAAGPAAAGAWPRAEGEAFVSLGSTLAPEGEMLVTGTGSLRSYTSVYAEYGLTPKWTIGLDAGFGQGDGDRTTAALVFARYPLWQTDSGHHVAAELGIGYIDEQVDTPNITAIMDEDPEQQFRIRPGLSWGKGFESRWGGGWMGIESSLEWRAPTGELAFKTDLTAGLKPSDRWMGILQLQYGNYPDSDPVLRLVPSVVRKFGSRTHLQLGIMAPLVGDDTPGIKFATWITF